MFTVVCTGTDDATASASATLNVTGSSEPPTPEPTVSASLSATVVKAHVTTVDLTWNSTGTTWCERDGTALSGTSGSETGFGPFYEGSHSFTVTCGSETDTQTASATVTVRAATAVACSAHPTAPFRALRIAVGEHTHSVTGANVGTVFGDNPYTSDSPISKAAVHAGIVAVGESAIIRLTQENGQFSFSGTTRNGVTSRSLDSWRSQYTLEKVSDCGATAPAIPEAPANLVSSENPSPDGSFSLSWDAPSGTGATPTGYLVYRSGSKSGYLSKTFADRTLSITGLSNGSYAYKVFACTGTVASPDCGPAANITVTVEIPDNDNDGIPDATDPDDDNDGMTDVWELENDLDDKDASDATQDADLDGHNNLAEFTAGSDPNWNLSYPGNIPEASDGFSSSYTVERGLIGGNDQLQDILIRNPTSDIVPAVSDFVLIQQSGGGFMIEDPSLHTIPSRLTAISSVIRLHDLNADGYTDMLLHSLDSNVQGASNDLIVFSNYSDPGTIPEDHVELSLKKTTFLEQVATWLDDEDYFDDNASVAAVVPEVVTDSISILADANGQALIGALSFTLNYQQLRPYGCYLPLHKCVKVVADYSDLAYDTGGLGLVHKPKNYDISIVDLLDDPNEPNYYGYFRVRFSPTLTYTVLNYSGFNERAILFTDFLSLSESLVREDILAIRISQGLEWALETAVFNGGLKSDTQGIFPVITENSTYEKVVREFFKILADVRRRVCFSGSSCDAESETDSPDMVMPESEEECYSTEEGCSRPLDVVPLPSQCSADLSSPGTITISRVGGGLLQLSSDPVSMPAVSYEAAVSGMNGECTVTSYAWSAQLSSEFIGKRARRDAEGNVVRDEDGDIINDEIRHTFDPHNFAATTTPSPSNPANSWPINWGTVLAGGDLIVSVTANVSFNGAEVGPVTARTRAEITGNRERLTDMLKQVAGITVEDLAVAWKESFFGHYQFDNSGQPLYGFPDGWGIMQIDNIPGFSKTEAHFWNWRTNLQVGIDYLDRIYNGHGEDLGALDWLKLFYRMDDPLGPEIQSPGISHPWGWSPYEAASNWRVWDDVFSRYNTGTSMYRPNGNDGIKHCVIEEEHKEFDENGKLTRGDIYVNSTGCKYSEEIRGFINMSPWDVPAN